jgi:hypothetical protein
MKRQLLFVHGGCAEKVSHASFREFEGRGHQLDDDLSEVAHDIASLERTGS